MGPVLARNGISFARLCVRYRMFIEEIPTLENDKNAVANPGIVRPPIVYLTAAVLGLIMDRFIPSKIPFEHYAKPIGGFVFILALLLFLLTHRQFRLANTPIPGNRSATSVICSGPFKFSRNPMYLAFSLLQVSAAIWFQNGWILVTSVLSVAVMTFFVIPREERFMALKFGLKFSTYRSITRMWI